MTGKGLFFAGVRVSGSVALTGGHFRGVTMAFLGMNEGMGQVARLAPAARTANGVAFSASVITRRVVVSGTGSVSVAGGIVWGKAGSACLGVDSVFGKDVRSRAQG